MEPKPCGQCGVPMLPTPYEQSENRQQTRRTYCSRECAGLARRSRVKLVCDTCEQTFEVWQSKETERRFCSMECYQEHHATDREERRCEVCGDTFLRYSDDARFCSRECFGEWQSEAYRGEGNPNYGNRNPGMWTMPGEMRAQLSQGRMGADNPNWLDGRGAGRYRFQTFVSEWAREHLGSTCERCGDEDVEVHHIVAVHRFPEVPMAHFRQNLAVLCIACHRGLDAQGRKAIDEGRTRDLPFADRLPAPILDQLGRGGSVSWLPDEVDFQPLGNAAEEVVRPEWFSGTSA